VPNKRALGRGLATLLPAREAEPDDGSASPATPVTLPVTLPVTSLVPNPFQPRRNFEHKALSELAQSIKADGIIQPLVVRRRGEQYELIAGERRWRAAQLAGLENVPVYVQETPDDRMLEVALIENIQREDLNPMETAAAFEKLNIDLGLSHEEIGQRTGKDRATVSNFIRLLQLPGPVQDLVAFGKLSPGHARPLLRLNTHEAVIKMAQQIIESEWTVREVEKALAGPNPGKKPDPVPAKPVDPNVRAAIDELERALGTRVRIIDRGKGKGRVEIDYFSQEDLDRIYSLIVQTT
jgi:ParB family chromosome partitioning protein